MNNTNKRQIIEYYIDEDTIKSILKDLFPQEIVNTIKLKYYDLEYYFTSSEPEDFRKLYFKSFFANATDQDILKKKFLLEMFCKILY